jgi:hypothetical protein
MGMHQMPGNVWWRSWRTLPPPAPYADCQSTDPDFSWQGQWPPSGSWQTYSDPQSGQQFNVWEGHYVYTGSDLTFVPTYAGGMFEGLMANEVVPETTWGPHSFGLADVRTAQVQIKTRLNSSTTRSGACRRPASPTTVAGMAASGSRALRSRTTEAGRTPATRTRDCPSAMAAQLRTL